MKYEIKRYYSTFISIEIEANSEEDAYNQSKELKIDFAELQNNLEIWEEADEVIQVKENNNLINPEKEILQ